MTYPADKAVFEDASGHVTLPHDLFIEGGLIDLKNDGGAVSQIKFYCESSNAHAQTLIGAPHSESASNTLTLPSSGGDATKLAVGFSPGKAYVKGYEIDTIATTFLNVDKARDFDTQNNFNTRFDVGNFVNVTNVYGSPDIASASGVEAFKGLTLHDTATSSRGTSNAGSGSSITTIGRAKTRGFEYNSGTATSNIFSSSSLTSAVYKHYLFDIVLYTHLNIKTAQAFTTGEVVTGSTSGATGVVQSLSTATSETISGATAALEHIVVH